MRRRRELLSAPQRAQLYGAATGGGEREMARHYTLSAADRAIIEARRRPHNRLGFALQLCYLRFPGRPWRRGEAVPDPLLAFVADQLGIAPADAATVLADYGRREQTWSEHLVELQGAFGFVPFTLARYREFSAWLLPLAMQTTGRAALVGSLLEELRRRSVLAPALPVLERLVAETRHRAERRVFRTLTEGLDEEDRSRLDALLDPREGSRASTLSWLRQPAPAPSAANLLGVLERLAAVRALGLDPGRGQRVHGNRLLQLAREGLQSTVQHLRDFEPGRRHATLVTVLLELGATLTDDAVEMFGRLISALFRRAERAHTEAFVHSGKAINEKVRLYAQVGQALLHAREQGADPFAAVAAVLPWERFAATVAEAAALARPADFDILEHIGDHYVGVRRWAPTLLAALDFRAAAPLPALRSLLRALDLLRELNAAGRRVLPADAPTGFVPRRWRPLVCGGENGALDRRHYELCALAELRERLRSGDVWVAGSRQYRDFEEYLLTPTAFQTLREEGPLPLAVPADFAAFLAERRQLYDERLARVSAAAARGELTEVEIAPVTGELKVAALRRTTPEAAEELARHAYALLPRVRVTELLAEVDAWTGFRACFTHLRTGLPPAERRVLLTAVLADAINLGLTRMADACGAASLRQLAWTADWHVRDETYAAGLARIIDFHHAQPFAGHWGAGETSSSDGQHFFAGGRGEAAGEVNARYGCGPGVSFYTHVSDQFGPFHTKVIAATAGEAAHVLDGLLHHESSLEIREHYTDTGGFSEHVFALCQLLGFRFAPRIRDLKDKRLYSVGKPPPAGSPLAPLFAGPVNLALVEARWPEVLRLAASIKTGVATASLLLGKLGAYPQQNGLSVALRELGRLEKTLFTLDWLESPALRRRVHVGLNKGEARNALARAVFFHRLGELRERTYENQRHRASGLNLVVAAVTLWNTVYLERAVAALQTRLGTTLPAELLAHLSPLGWEHVNLTGDYVWEEGATPFAAEGGGLGQLRPLRRP